jgi:hypothetical protein
MAFPLAGQCTIGGDSLIGVEVFETVLHEVGPLHAGQYEQFLLTCQLLLHCEEERVRLSRRYLLCGQGHGDSQCGNEQADCGKRTSLFWPLNHLCIVILSGAFRGLCETRSRRTPKQLMLPIQFILFQLGTPLPQHPWLRRSRQHV